ncbi:2'-5' RNA ligase family protein [Altererythrobacter sp. HHU K3-1]|uniref:2'-5' RNA ligase family protein n=1 Tax=Qipengyuania atrilutea TaxID=2744473 RepID=A0A850H307_9SPHN|nr:2'-5' RNA ligase family protein [Actirhodobacter atriluteus]
MNLAQDSDAASDAPLILTARLPRDLHAWATRLRDAHFPPERNHLEAHVTLFHALPPSCRSELCDLLAAIVRENAPVQGQIEGIMSLGRGTAIKLSSPGMLDLRGRIADRFHGMLMPQDEHTPRLHVTVQNKVAPQEAKALQAELAPQVEPRAFSFAGFALYRYLGGPWGFIRDWSFRG